ncbi:MAG: deoxyribonuclease V [Armatimonadetes bacterium]|nr:deoxyribonuclease V [Anaerolineae bacterium]
MQLNTLHSWDLTPTAAIALQRELAVQCIVDQPLALESVRWVAGVDVSVQGDESQAAVVVMTYPELQVVETVLARQPTPFPYIPGLLTFREGPVLVEAFAQLQQVPDVFIFDGMGRAHPRRIGIAAHLGLWLDKPTIGCGKTHLIGAYTDPGLHKGAASYLSDKGEVIGAVLRTRANTKPVFISAGHRIDLDSALRLVMACSPQYRLPEPIRAAHRAAGKM